MTFLLKEILCLDESGRDRAVFYLEREREREREKKVGGSERHYHF
jgi:hypothetical protein